MNEISGPISVIVSRLNFHRATGFTLPNQALNKLLGNYSIAEMPETRGQWDQDLPAIGINLGSGMEAISPKFVYAGRQEIQLELYTSRDDGLADFCDSGSPKGLFVELEKVLDALRTNEQGAYDPYLCATTNTPIEITWQDPVSYQKSFAITLRVHFNSKPYKQLSF